MSGKTCQIVLSRGRRLSFPCLIERGEFGCADRVSLGASSFSSVLRADLSPVFGAVLLTDRGGRGFQTVVIDRVWSVSFMVGCWRGFGFDRAGWEQTIVFGRGRKGKKAAKRFCAASKKAARVL